MFTGLLNTSFDVYTNKITGYDSIGGVTRTMVLRYSTIPAFFTYLTGKEQNLYGKRNIRAEYRLFCDAVEMESTDIVKVNGDYYNVSFINKTGLDLLHHWEILLIAVKAPQDIVLESGWTWGEQYPTTQLPESWRTWTYLNTTTEATNTGAWGELQLRNTENFVSPVKDAGDTNIKTITLSYDDYDICTHNSGRIIWWRGSNTLFSQSDLLPSWTLYSGSFATNFRYIQVRAGIYV